MQNEPHLDAPVEDTPTPAELVRHGLYNEARRCLNDNDRILALSVKSEELLEVVKEVAAALGHYAVSVFPPMGSIDVVPDQAENAMIRRLSDEESAIFSEYVRGFVEYVNISGGLADQMGLNRIEVQGPNGPFQYVPLVYDSKTMRQAIFSAMVSQYEQHRNKKLIEVPNSIGSIPVLTPR